MGAGIALEFKLRYPEMFTKYLSLCEKKQIEVGKLWIYKESSQWVLNFPTKQHWKYPSKLDYLKSGLDKFMQSYQVRGIQSIAFPVLGTSKGGLPEDQVLSLMEGYLKDCTIPVEVYQYAPKATDDLFIQFRQRILESSDAELMLQSGLRKQAINKLSDALTDNSICTISQLSSVPGIGAVTLEKAFALTRAPVPQKQNSIFDLD
jgi:hypothetical protein